VNWRRGFFRVWVVYATVAYSAGGLYLVDSYANQYVPPAEALIEYFSVPIAVLIVSSVLFTVGSFVVNGFRADAPE